MPVKVTHQLHGLDGLVASLQGIGLELRTVVITEGVREGGKVVTKSIKRSLAKSVDTGALQDSIGYSVKKQRKKGSAVSIVGPRWGHFGGKDGQQPARYAHLVEFGHVNRNGTQTAANPFMAPGTASSVNEVKMRMTLGIQKGLTKAAKKHTKNKSR